MVTRLPSTQELEIEGEHFNIMFIDSILTIKQPLTLGVRIAVFFHHATEAHARSPDTPQELFCCIRHWHSGRWALATRLTIPFGHSCPRKNKEANIHLASAKMEKLALLLSMGHSQSHLR